MYSDYGTAFDGAESWSFGNDFARNIVIFGVNNNSSSDADNHKNDFLMLVEVRICGINESFGATEQKISIKFTIAKTKFCLICIMRVIIVISLLTE